jgi:DNA mismatch repair protein MutL
MQMTAPVAPAPAPTVAPSHTPTPVAPHAIRQELTPEESLAFLRELHTASANVGVQAPKAEEPKTAPAQEFRASMTITPVSSPTPTSAPKPIIPEHRFVGQAFHTYLFVEIGEELLVIDQHAAHERIIFEELLERQKQDGEVSSQGMIIPLRVNLTKEEYAAILTGEEELESLGFAFLKEEGGISLMAIPSAISPTDASDLIVRIAHELDKGFGTPSTTIREIRERALYQIACKAAIKGGRIYDQTQLEHLIEQVLSLPDITVCPHGRPIAYRLTKKEMDRQFERLK